MHGLEPTKFPGLFKYKGVFWARFKPPGGKQVYKSLKTRSGTDALAALAGMRKEAELDTSAKAFADGIDKPRTVGYCIGLLKRKYFRSAEHSIATKDYVAERMRMVFKHWPALFRMNPAKVTTEQIETWKQKMLMERKPSSVRGSLIYLSEAFDVGVRLGVCKVNPCTGVPLPKSNRQIQISEKHQLSTETWDEVVAKMRKGTGAWRQPAADLAELLAATGLRIGEAKQLRWGHVNWNRRELNAPTEKGRKKTNTQDRTRCIPFFPRLEEWLLRHKGPGPTEPLIRVKDCRQTMAAALKKLGLPRLHHHDLRHLFTTWAIEGGVDIPTVADWLGHSDGGALLMRTYRHHRREHSQAQATKMPAPAPKPSQNPMLIVKTIPA